MANYPIYRQVKGSPLTFQEMDGNLEWLSRTMSASIVTITGSTFVLGNLNVSDGITGSLFGTSSWSQNSVTSSYPISVTGSTLYSTNPLTSQLNATNTIALGNSAGFQARAANNSNFLGQLAGYQATSASNSNFLGRAGYTATNANDSNFLGLQAGYAATSASYSNFLGLNAGFQATLASYSNFLGPHAGYAATSASYSNFLGYAAGAGATNANNSNFIGYSAGTVAADAHNSNFIGYYAGFSATKAQSSNFLGRTAGYEAISASYSNFLGLQAGYQATSASYSNFLGYNAGLRAASASYSILLGYNVGRNDIFTNGIGSNNIIIGTNITLPNNASRAINIGGILFGTGSHNTTLGNPFSGSANGKIGINNPNPIETLDISGSLRATEFIYFPGISNSTYPYIVSVDTSSGKLYYTNQITGSLFGTSSWAISASYAVNAISASYVSGSAAIITNLTSSNDARINGVRVGRGNNNQIENTVVGDLAFVSNQTGTRNTAVGFEALYYNSTGRFNTAYGWDALYFNSVGEQNVAIGYSALQSNRSGSFNTILGGVNTAYEITSGSWNTILGSNSGRAITIGNNNTIIGGRLNNSFTPGAPFTTTMSDNVILGDGKGYIRYRFDGIQNNFYDNIVVTGSITATTGFTGSLFGTSSWSQNSVTASTLNQTSSVGFVSNMSDTYTSTAKITDIITLSAAEYAAIGSPLTSTLYVII